MVGGWGLFYQLSIAASAFQHVREIPLVLENWIRLFSLDFRQPVFSLGSRALVGSCEEEKY